MNEHVRKNRRAWNADSDAYQERHRSQLDGNPLAWGVWALSEARLGALGPVRGKDVLELGCGAAQWSIRLAGEGARVVGMDVSEAQLAHARRDVARAGVRVPLVHGNAEEAPFRNASFDLVFCDHGATSFTDPRRTVPEVARLLRPGGWFVFNVISPLLELCWNAETGRAGTELVNDGFGVRRIEDEEAVSFQPSYGEWIRLFRRAGLAVEDLIELRPDADATTTYHEWAPLEWARRWPSENVWRLRKE